MITNQADTKKQPALGKATLGVLEYTKHATQHKSLQQNTFLPKNKPWETQLAHKGLVKLKTSSSSNIFECISI
jgi:hypothetical protein